MLNLAITFFVIAIIAMLLGMGGIAGLSAQIGYILVFASLVFLVVSLIARRGSPPRTLP